MVKPLWYNIRDGRGVRPGRGQSRLQAVQGGCRGERGGPQSRQRKTAQASPQEKTYLTQVTGGHRTYVRGPMFAGYCMVACLDVISWSVMSDLTQAEANALLAMEKLCTNTAELDFPTCGTKIQIP